MPDFPIIRNVDPLVLSTAIPQSIGTMLAGANLAMGNQTLTSDKAYYIPVSVNGPITIVKMFFITGTSPSGNVDLGIYDRGGTRLVSTGSTAVSGSATTTQVIDVTDTILSGGLYYLALALSSGGGVQAWAPAVANCRAMGVLEQASAFPLPSSATFAALSTTGRIPFVAATQRTVV